jgi:hypothetical protein
MAARWLHIPGLIDVARVSDEKDLSLLVGDTRLDRRFEGRGPLVNRVLTQRIREVLMVDGVRLPSVAPREDAARTKSQGALEKDLNEAAEALPSHHDSADGIAAVLTGEAGDAELGPAVQQAVGRLFAPDYRATPASWQAAVLLDAAVHTRNPFKPLVWRLTGRLRRAQHLLAGMVNGDLAGVHATGIAVHNLVHGFAKMGELWRDPAACRALSTNDAVARCLFAPPSVLRQAEMSGQTVIGNIRPGTLVVYELGTLREHGASPDTAFLAGSWARCPAEAWVMSLLRTVWERMLQTGPQGKQP